MSVNRPAHGESGNSRTSTDGTTDNGYGITIPCKSVAALQRQEVERIGRDMAAERGLATILSAQASTPLAGLAGVRFAIIERGDATTQNGRGGGKVAARGRLKQ